MLHTAMAWHFKQHLNRSRFPRTSNSFVISINGMKLARHIIKNQGNVPGLPFCTASEAKSDCKYTDYMYLIIYPIVKRQLVATVKSCSDICVAAECQHQSVNSLQHRETRELRVTAEPLFFLIPFHLSYTTHRCHIVSGRTKGNIFPSCRNAH